jgi:hypothetical protein
VPLLHKQLSFFAISQIIYKKLLLTQDIYNGIYTDNRILNWIESSVYIYAPTIKGISLNAIRAINLVPYRYLLRLAEKNNILQKIKILWKDKLISDKNGTDHIK